MTSRLDPAKLVDDATRLVGSSLGELIPPAAQRHLLNAQRELLLAVAALIDHHMQSSDEPEEPADGAKGRSGKRTRAGTGRSRRPARVELE
ncbi:MAG TPA: hypothetical protein VI434_01365 [Candidatus Dormibacteraeota bacterium]